MAFSREGAAWLWESVSMWDTSEHDALYEQWATAMRPHSLTNRYTNLTDDQGSQWRRTVHGSEAKHRRLGAVKAAWDPENLLRFNKNITPESAAPVH
ncbi:BBE domain-containing protein [Streptomyces sp. NBC_01445]|uniref:BBE domain-containing protein n=1 Tax=Streptomyces sp. NBC_01445 TaxID=2903869 RepID=UPI002DDB8AF1|nr:BBE domain-containing protein [Streptomyces sp. NBC_01445]WSE03746.1 BBE domain-containing protein [Streptomyces sp. NBC_01445]